MFLSHTQHAFLHLRVAGKNKQNEKKREQGSLDMFFKVVLKCDMLKNEEYGKT